MVGSRPGTGTGTVALEHQRRVVCVEGNRMFSELLGVAIDLEPDLELAARVEDVVAAVDVVRGGHVDVVVVDCAAGIDGVDAVRQVKQVDPGTRVVLLFGSPTLELLVRAASAGADGFLAKDSSLADIMEAMRSDAHGVEIRDGTLEALRLRVRSEGQLGGRRWDPHLTDRERDVLVLLAEGLDPQTIASQLGITVHTSRSYVRNVLSKLGAHSQLEAVVIAARCGIVRGLCTCGDEDDDAGPAGRRAG